MIHGIEEYFTGFYKIDDILFGHLPVYISQPTFVIFQLLWWTLLITIGTKMNKRTFNTGLLTAIGLVYIFEAHHLIHAFFIEKSYYPSVVTALAFPVVAFFYWKELLKNWSK